MCDYCENRNEVWAIENCRLFMRNDEFFRALKINYCPNCGKRLDAAVGDERVPPDEIAEMFEVLWKAYPRKEGKEQAKKTFEHKLRGMKRNDAKAKANKMFLLIRAKRKVWEENETELKFIPMFSTMLNAEVPDSPFFGGGKKI